MSNRNGARTLHSKILQIIKHHIFCYFVVGDELSGTDSIQLTTEQYGPIDFLYFSTVAQLAETISSPEQNFIVGVDGDRVLGSCCNRYDIPAVVD